MPAEQSLQPPHKGRLCPVFACLVLLLLAVFCCAAHAGVLRNEDEKEYKVTVHWEDLSPPETFVMAPGEKRHFEDKPSTVELVGRKDNIYVRPQEEIVIRGGVMRRLLPEE